MDIALLGPHHPDTALQYPPTQLALISIIGQVGVESPKVLPQSAPNEKGKTPDFRQVNPWSGFHRRDIFLRESAYLAVVPIVATQFRAANGLGGARVAGRWTSYTNIWITLKRVLRRPPTPGGHDRI